MTYSPIIFWGCYIAISAILFWESLVKNPHYRTREWRLERAFLTIFCLFWPVTLPLALFVWNRSKEKRLLNKQAKRRKEKRK